MVDRMMPMNDTTLMPISKNSSSLLLPNIIPAPKQQQQYQQQYQQQHQHQQQQQQLHLIKPGPFDVICARGKQAYNHAGNKYFRSMIAKATTKYSNAESKLHRSMIVTEIVDAMRARGNGFIRQTLNGEWCACSDVMCREKIGQHFRKNAPTKFKQRVKEMCTSKLVEELNNLVLSNNRVKQTMERFSMDVIFIIEDDEVAFLEKAFQANIKLLNIFKEDTSGLVQKFHHQYLIGQHMVHATCNNIQNNYNHERPSTWRCGSNARAA